MIFEFREHPNTLRSNRFELYINGLAMGIYFPITSYSVIFQIPQRYYGIDVERECLEQILKELVKNYDDKLAKSDLFGGIFKERTKFEILTAFLKVKSKIEEIIKVK